MGRLAATRAALGRFAGSREQAFFSAFVLCLVLCVAALAVALVIAAVKVLRGGSV